MHSVLLLTLLSAFPLVAGPLVVLTYDQEFQVSYEGEGYEISFSPGWTIRPHWKYVDGLASAGGSLTRYGTIRNPWPEPQELIFRDGSQSYFAFAGLSDQRTDSGQGSLVGPLQPGQSIPYVRTIQNSLGFGLGGAVWSAHPSGTLVFSSTFLTEEGLEATLDHTDVSFGVGIVAVFETPEPSYAPVMGAGLGALLFLAGRRKRPVRRMAGVGE